MPTTQAAGSTGSSAAPRSAKSCLLHLPVNHEPIIDGFRAQDGIIVEGYEGILSAGHMEPRPFEIVFETPAAALLEKQIASSVAAMTAILRRYRAMLSLANDI